MIIVYDGHMYVKMSCMILVYGHRIHIQRYAYISLWYIVTIYHDDMSLWLVMMIVMTYHDVVLLTLRIDSVHKLDNTCLISEH